MTDNRILEHCTRCGELTDEYELFHIKDPSNMRAEQLCPVCYKDYLAEPEKPIQESSKPATDVDIHKIIDDAMEKKDRSVTIFINKDATTVSVYPYEDKPTEWIVLDRNGNWFRCPECGSTYRDMSPYCPECGEKLKRPN